MFLTLQTIHSCHLCKELFEQYQFYRDEVNTMIEIRNNIKEKHKYTQIEATIHFQKSKLNQIRYQLVQTKCMSRWDLYTYYNDPAFLFINEFN